MYKKMPLIKLNTYTNPWQKRSRKQIYRNQWMGIYEDEVIRPDARPGIYAFMDCHPAVGVVPVDTYGQTCLVGQYRYPLACYSWEIPTGMGEAGESVVDTARRELAEETGLIANELIELGRFNPSNSLSNEEATIFLAPDCRVGETRRDATEVIHIARMPLTEAIARARSGEIRDAMSLLGLFWAEQRL
jgi:8-oxo-dGTP pyrophosphatase MutT (NUDIX family)